MFPKCKIVQVTCECASCVNNFQRNQTFSEKKKIIIISPHGVYSSCSGAFNHITPSSSAEFAQLSWIWSKAPQQILDSFVKYWFQAQERTSNFKSKHAFMSTLLNTESYWLTYIYKKNHWHLSQIWPTKAKCKIYFSLFSTSLTLQQFVWMR